jgi:hypothetical protein
MDYTNLLQQHDDPKHWEYPAGFDYDAVTARFAKCAEALSTALGIALKLETGSYIQDASFHSQIYVPIENERYAMIRFSNFGDMVSVGTCYFGEMAPDVGDKPIPPALLKAIVAVLEKEGYVYVPAEVLTQPYTGKNPGVTGIRDWWIRYFDWV